MTKTTKPAKQKKQTKEKKQSPITKMREYFKGVKTEWGKITFAPKNQVVGEFFIVLAVVLFFTILIYLIDIILKGAFSLIPTA